MTEVYYHVSPEIQTHILNYSTGILLARHEQTDSTAQSPAESVR